MYNSHYSVQTILFSFFFLLGFISPQLLSLVLDGSDLYTESLDHIVLMYLQTMADIDQTAATSG